jgi:NAD(P)H-quinone oxidoreductase subunit 6
MNMLSLPDGQNLPIIYFLDVGIVLGALGVVFLRKIIYSALLLGFVFICVALWYLLLNADFLAAAQVLIYVGAVNVLIVFAIMLVNKPNAEVKKNTTIGEILAGSMFIGLFGFLTKAIISIPWQDLTIKLTESPDDSTRLDSIDIIGIHILTDLLLPFELLSVLLLVGLAGAITIARKDQNVVKSKNNTELDITRT